MELEVGQSIELGGNVYEVTKQVDEYTYEISNTESGEVLPYILGRPVSEEPTI